MSDRPAPEPLSTLQVRLGELDAGAIATGTRGGVVELEGPRPESRTTVSWWVGAEDRWHVPAQAAGTRDRLLRGAPVLETLVRIPSGDAAGHASVARLDGDDGPSVVVDVENRSPVPVSFAWVVSSTEPVAVGREGISVAGVGQLRLTRSALAGLLAADTDAILERV